MASPDDRPPGNVAIVTGGSRGVGGATACWLAGIGFAVVVNFASDEEAATAIVESIHDDHGVAIAVRANVVEAADVARLFRSAEDTFGGVDAVVHAVIGQAPAGQLADTPVAQFDSLYALNARATFLVNRAAARQVRRGGAIVNLTSSLVSQPIAASGAHAASRAPTDVITRVLALELASRDISVNAIALNVDGPCRPDRFVDAVAFLLSERGHRVTGQVVRVDDRWRELETRRNGDSLHRPTS